jgi:phage terminase large subunit-like protein
MPASPAALEKLQRILEIAADKQNVPTLEPHQRPPEAFLNRDVPGWLMLGGRGAGKTFGSMRYLSDEAHRVPGLRARIIAPTLDDAVNSCVLDSKSGLIAYDREARLIAGLGGTRVVWPNGSTCWLIGTPTLRDVDRLRALTNIELDVFEEAAANPMLARAVEQARFSRRGDNARWVATTSPRPLPQIIKWTESDDVAMTHATSFDNPHLTAEYREALSGMEGTRLYRQEALAEILMAAEGARWQYEWLDRSRVHELPESIDRWVVAVDPASGSGTTGIVAACRDSQGHIYVTDDASVKDASPEEWAAAVVRLADFRNAVIVAEDNQGGRMVEATIKATGTHLPVKTKRATMSKEDRADPVALLWEKQPAEAHMVGVLPALEDQLVSWEPWPDGKRNRESPDRLDAMVWACSWLAKPDQGTITVNPNSQAVASGKAMRGKAFY